MTGSYDTLCCDRAAKRLQRRRDKTSDPVRFKRKETEYGI